MRIDVRWGSLVLVLTMALGVGCGSRPIGGTPEPGPEPGPVAPEPALLTGAWGASGQIAPARNGWSQHVVVDRLGRAWVIWTDNGIWAARFDGAWSQPTRIASVVDRLFGDIAAVGNDAGDVLVAWRTSDLVDGAVRGASVLTLRHQEGAGWSPVEVVTSVPSSEGYLLGPSLAQSDDGASLVAWQVRRSGSPGALWVARARPGTGWSAPERLASGDLTYLPPVIGLGGQGLATVAWVEGPGATRVLARRGRPGEWEPSQLLNGGEAEPQGVEGIWAGMSLAGSATVLWLHGAGGIRARAVSASEAPAAGTWSAAATVVEGLHAWWAGARPEVAFGASGHVLVAWRQADEALTESHLMTRERTPEGDWGTPAVAAPGLAPPYFGCAEIDGVGHHPSIDGLGNAVVVWEDKVGPWQLATGVVSRPAGGSWSAPIQLSTAETPVHAPAAATSGGTAVAAWFQDTEGLGRTLWASRLAP